MLVQLVNFLVTFVKMITMVLGSSDSQATWKEMYKFLRIFSNSVVKYATELTKSKKLDDLVSCKLSKNLMG